MTLPRRSCCSTPERIRSSHREDHTNVLMIAAAGYFDDYYAVTTVNEDDTNEVIRMYLAHGVDINAFNDHGSTALHLAAERGTDKVVGFLAQNGAKLDARDRQGRLPIDAALQIRNTHFAGATIAVPPRESMAALLRQLVAGNQAANTLAGTVKSRDHDARDSAGFASCIRN